MNKYRIKRLEKALIGDSNKAIPYCIKNESGLTLEKAKEKYRKEHPELDCEPRPRGPKEIILCDPDGKWMSYMGAAYRRE